MRANFPGSVFGPPFKGLWFLLLLYYAGCFVFCPDSQIVKGNLPDSDDYMYLAQVLDWLHGQGWYDNIQHRLNPPEGVMIHFSRIAMLPMAAMILIFERLGMEEHASALLMAAIYPPLLFAGFFVVMRWVAKSFVPKKWAGATASIALFSMALIFMFQPGHVDHHGLAIIIVAAALGCALRMMEHPRDSRWGLVAGALLAFGMMLALEILPWLLLIAAGLGLWAVLKGRAAARQGLLFGLALHFTSIVCLILTRPLDMFFTVDYLTYSVAYVLLTGGIAVTFAAAALAASLKKPLRIAAAAATAAVTGALFLFCFPALIAGPYGAINPALSAILLKAVSEAKPMLDVDDATSSLGLISDLAYYLAGTLLAVTAALYFFWAARGEKRWTWGLLLTLLIPALLLTAFYELRFSGVMEMLAIIPLVALLQKGCEAVDTRWRGIPGVLAKIGVFLLIAPVPMVLLPYTIEPLSFNGDIMLFPAAGVYTSPCDMHALAAVLDDPSFVGGRTRLLLNTIDTGPELLFRTPHQVLAAPFHTDVSGNIDAYRFFSTTDPEEAKTIAMRRHADLIVTCVAVPSYYLQDDSRQIEEGIPHEFRSHFVDAMTKMPLDWLALLYLPQLENFMIYRVIPPQIKDGP